MEDRKNSISKPRHSVLDTHMIATVKRESVVVLAELVDKFGRGLLSIDDLWLEIDDAFQDDSDSIFSGDDSNDTSGADTSVGI